MRKQIFNATMPDEGDGYRLETGISLREYDMCDEKFKTKLATSLAGYKKVSTSIQFTTKLLWFIRYDLDTRFFKVNFFRVSTVKSRAVHSVSSTPKHFQTVYKREI